jgi:polysaccharide chain length determinant protein (PEP-CTERM system associated)
VHEVVDDVLDHARGVWRFRRMAIGLGWLGALLGWLVVLAWPDSYESSARVYVATSTPLRPLLQGISVEQDVDAQLNLVRASLLGRPELEAVARAADLDVHVKTPADRDALIESLQKSILIDAQAPEGNDNQNRRSMDSVYTIRYQNTDRLKALAVVKSLLNYLVEETLGGKRSGSDEAQKFLREQIADYEKRLVAAEGALAEFKRHNVGLVPGTQGDYFTRLQNENLASRKAQQALDVALRRREELARQVRGERPLVPGVIAGANGTAGQSGNLSSAMRGGDTATRIAEAQARLDDLLLRFTDKHPDVIAARETLAELKKRLDAELAAAQHGDAGAAAASGLAANPVYQGLQVQLNQADVEIAALRADLSDHQRAEADLHKLLSTAPEVEAQYSQLNRDYDVTKAQYNSLLDRLDKAKLAGDAAQTGIVRFDIIDPPSAGTHPVKPKRPLLLAGVLASALGLGVAVAWLMAVMNPVFSSVRTLRDRTGLPVLGAVSLTWVERAKSQFHRSLAGVAGGVAVLLAICGVAVALSDQGAQFVHRLIQWL